jgi:hypothetical protein
MIDDPGVRGRIQPNHSSHRTSAASTSRFHSDLDISHLKVDSNLFAS